MPYLDASSGTIIRIPFAPGAPEQVHVFDEDEITAINTALAARRALLVRGEPGTGKTQLARAAAVHMRRPIATFVVDARSDSRDLLWHFDAVRRLADAQVFGALFGHRGSAVAFGQAVTADAAEDAILKSLSEKLDTAKYVQPRALWWGLNWNGAKAQAEQAKSPAPSQRHDCDPKNGVVVLIDEIDKADADVPNGLLETLGSLEFTMPGSGAPIRPQSGSRPPLVVITTNEERALPDAFVRRCVVLTLRLPPNGPKLIAHLVARGRAHFGQEQVSDDVLARAAELLAADRKTAQDKKWRPLPGQAEFMDLLRAVYDLGGPSATAQLACLDKVARFALRKHAPEPDP
jgi:MoxR-like ATPase